MENELIKKKIRNIVLSWFTDNEKVTLNQLNNVFKLSYRKTLQEIIDITDIDSWINNWSEDITTWVGESVLKFENNICNKLNFNEEYGCDFNYSIILNSFTSDDSSSETSDDSSNKTPDEEYVKKLLWNILMVYIYNTENLDSDNGIYKHGFGGIIDYQEKIKPTFWYNKLHPFEFEVIVNHTPSAHKLFNNLRIISNKAAPESFHYEIIGECFDFADDKENAYYRQEAKKEFFRNLGSNISYNKEYQNINPKQNNKSVSFPLYYCRQDKDENIEDSYLDLKDEEESKDYRNLSGTEIVRYDKLNEMRMWLHNKAVDIKKAGRLRGNMLYLEDFWNILINPIIIIEKNEYDDNNETTWVKCGNENYLPPLDLINTKLPNDISKDVTILRVMLPDPYKKYDSNTTENNSNTNTTENNSNTIENCFDLISWGKRREIKLKDKWMKIRIRYSGEDLALISHLSTLYSISYA